MMDETGRSADDGDGSCGTPLTRNRLLLMSGLASGGERRESDAAGLANLSGLEALDFWAWKRPETCRAQLGQLSAE